MNFIGKSTYVGWYAKMWLLILLVCCSFIKVMSFRCLNHLSCNIGEEKKIISCSDSIMDDVPLCLNPKLISLSLHNSKIRTLYVTSFRYYMDLRYVNLSHNQITRIDHKTFEYQHNLEELHLAGNKITRVDPLMFNGLSNLTVLSLKGNLLEELSENVFASMSRVEHLDLSANRISTISRDALNGLPKLSVLLMGSNLLTSVPSSSLMRVPHLAELSLGGNEFSEIRPDDFVPLLTLTSLDLSSTNLHNGIPDDVFASLSGLRILKLNDCQLKYIPVNSLLHLPRLEELQISKNLFESIPKGAFGGNRRLLSLSITGCPKLIRLSSGSLNSNLDLISLDISRNPVLAYLPPIDLRYLSLDLLDIHGNHLEYLPHDLANWDDIPNWHIHDNPFTCNCSVAWMKEMLQKQINATRIKNLPASNDSPVLCSHPPALRGSSLISISLTDLECGLSATTRGIVIAFSVCGLILMLAVLSFILLYRMNGNCVRQLLKGQKWGRSRSTTRSYDSNYPCIKPVPVTEL